ncbi:MAG: AMP-binding protein [Sandaracinus sp.]|nr:AMP-binding protein [Sandaracinus sp.]MCB9614817.1 AMP-binding protein [Sandaracinus sp.]
MGEKVGIDADLRRVASATPDRIALIDGAEATTFAALEARAARAAGALRQAGVQPGDRILLFARKSTASVAALYGAWRAGAVVVPASPEARGRQLEYLLEHSDARLALVDPLLVDRLDRPLPGPTRDVETLDGAPLEAVEHTELAALLYTSGSTGMPKGIVITHDNLVAGARIVSTYLQITADDRLLSVLPFHFDYGLNQLLTTVRQGATLVLQKSTHPGHVVRALHDHAITGLAGVPPLWAQLFADASPLLRAAPPSLRYLTNSGGAFPVELLRRARTALPETRIFLMYGLSEAFRSTYLPPEELDTHPTSMGRAIPETEILVLRDDGTHCEVDEAGELVHRGPTVAAGYWKDPETTAKVFRPDPDDAAHRVVHSGDQVRRGPEGFLYFVGRRDQRLKSFGHRVSPEEVERALQDCPLVALAVVGGEPDEHAGDAIVAHVVPANDAVDVDAIAAFARETMPRYLQPKRIVLHASFPLTSSGKVDRKQVLA